MSIKIATFMMFSVFFMESILCMVYPCPWYLHPWVLSEFPIFVFFYFDIAFPFPSLLFHVSTQEKTTPRSGLLISDVHTFNKNLFREQVLSNIQFDSFPVKFNGCIHVNGDPIHLIFKELLRFFWRCFHHRWKVWRQSAVFQVHLVHRQYGDIFLFQVLF